MFVIVCSTIDGVYSVVGNLDTIEQAKAKARELAEAGMLERDDAVDCVVESDAGGSVIDHLEDGVVEKYEIHKLEGM